MTRTDAGRRAAEVVLLALVVALGLWFALVRPAQDEAERLDGELVEVQADNAEAEAGIARLRAAEARAPEHRRALRRLAVALPAQAATADLVRQLDATGLRTGATLEGAGLGDAPPEAAELPALPPGAVAGAVPPPALPVELHFRGRYLRLADAVREVHGAVRAGERGVRADGRLVSIGSVVLTVDRDDPSVVAAELQALAHLAPEATP